MSVAIQFAIPWIAVCRGGDASYVVSLAIKLILKLKQGKIMEDNNKDENLALAETQDFKIVTTIDDFEINKDESEKIASSLAKSTVAKLAGTFTANEVGKRTLKATFNYEQGEPVEAVAETEVIAVKLEISPISPHPFPTSLPKNAEQEVEFIIKHKTELGNPVPQNIADFAATGITIDVEGLLERLTIIEEEPDGEDTYKAIELPIDINKFNEGKGKLNPLHQFRIKGTFKMGDGPTKLKILVKYDESKCLKTKDDQEGAKFEETINVQDIKVVGQVTTKLPTKIKLGSAHDVVFQFTNQSTEFPVTGVEITISQKEEKPEKATVATEEMIVEDV